MGQDQLPRVTDRDCIMIFVVLLKSHSTVLLVSIVWAALFLPRRKMMNQRRVSLWMELPLIRQTSGQS